VKKKYNSYKILVDNGEITPSAKHLEFACDLFTHFFVDDNFILYLLDHKVFPNRECLKTIIYKTGGFVDDSIKRIINVFYDLGIEFTKSDMETLVNRKICIENFKDFDLLTDIFFINCIRRQFYPPYLSKCKQSMICYYYVFSHNKINTLPDCVRDFLMFSCDLTCLRLASGILDNLETIKFILERNIDADQETIRKIIGEDNYIKLKIEYLTK
jgi:hypothetical protein